MQRFKLLGLALMAVFALGAVVSASASAALKSPTPLNKNGVEPAAVTFSGNVKATTTFSILEGFGETTCPEVSFEGEIKSLLGPFHIHWKKCTTNLGGTCTGLGDEAGLILTLGTAHLVFDSLEPLAAAVLFLLEHVHYACTVLGQTKLILVLGEVLCLITPTEVLTKKFKIKCEKGANAGDPKETMYWNEAGTLVEIPNGLLASEDEGVTYKMSAENGEVEAETAEEIKIDV
jgi:hypothetical protein